jgi:hypothetical protein
MTEIVIEGVSDLEFEIDLIGEDVEALPWDFHRRPYDYEIDGVTAPSNQGVDHETRSISRVDPAYAGRYFDIGLGSGHADAA